MRPLTGEEALAERCRGLVAQGRHAEEVMAFLRAEGCGKTKTIAVMADALGIGLAKAKELVHFSATWADVREKDETFHEMLARTDKSAPDSDSLEQE